LINNAAQLVRCAGDQVDPDEYLSLLNVNVVAPVALTKQAMPHLRKTKGSVVFVSSIGGERLKKILFDRT